MEAVEKQRDAAMEEAADRAIEGVVDGEGDESRVKGGEGESMAPLSRYVGVFS